MSADLMRSKHVNATSLVELRRLPAATLSTWPAKVDYGDQLFPGYFVDGLVMPAPPVSFYQSGQLNGEAVVAGSNSKDGTVQMYWDWPEIIPAWNATAEQYRHALVKQYGEAADRIEQQYPLARFDGSASSAFLQTNADRRLFCPTRRLLQFVARAKCRPVPSNGCSRQRGLMIGYEQWFSRGPRTSDYLSNEQGWNLTPPNASHFAAHGNDVWFTFNVTGTSNYLLNISEVPSCCYAGRRTANFSSCNATACSSFFDRPMPFTAEELPLVADMTKFWTSYAANAAPVPTGGRLVWPAYDPTSTKRYTMQLDTMLQVHTNFKDADCEFWDRA
eukprot:SAG31_NODE_2259_length_6068_cov_10.272240_1_plen_332_part_00